MPTEVVLVSASPRLLQRLPPDLTCPLEEVAAILVIDLFPKTFALALIVSWTDRSGTNVELLALIGPLLVHCVELRRLTMNRAFRGPKRGEEV